MKSIMEEASSLMKAIEKAWASAGHPKEFSIKIYEEAQKNFIGMTTKPAKIGIFFSEAPLAATQQTKAKKPATRPSTQAPIKPAPTQQQRATQPREHVPREHVSREQVSAEEQKPYAREERRQQPARPPRTKEAAPERVPLTEEELASKQERLGPVWTEEMISHAKTWTTEILQMMDLGHVPFSVQPEHFHLKIQFEKELYNDSKREKHLFASLAHLVLTMLKRHYKRPLKGYKIVLSGG